MVSAREQQDGRRDTWESATCLRVTRSSTLSVSDPALPLHVVDFTPKAAFCFHSFILDVERDCYGRYSVFYDHNTQLDFSW